MSSETQFDNRFGKLFELAEKAPNYCSYAGQFSTWAEELKVSLTEADIIVLNQAMLRLLHKYFDWLQIAPKNHRHKLSPNGHVCIYQVFISTYYELKKIELSLSPTPLHISEAVGPQIAGIFLGEKEK